MDPRVVPFHLGLGIGEIGSAFYISLVIWDPIHLFRLLLNLEIGLIVHLFDIFDIIVIVTIRHFPDNSNRSNWMSDSDLYDQSIEILQHSTFVIYSIHHTR